MGLEGSTAWACLVELTLFGDWASLSLSDPTPPPRLFQLDNDSITLKPRPQPDLTNSTAPSPSHKVQRSVSANPKQRRFSDQGESLPDVSGAAEEGRLEALFPLCQRQRDGK